MVTADFVSLASVFNELLNELFEPCHNFTSEHYCAFSLLGCDEC